jgi:16S rRNA processing protein RimM
MLLLGYLAKIQGLKGEFLFHELMDDPRRLLEITDLLLVPPSMNVDSVDTPPFASKAVQIRSFRMHSNRVCIAFKGMQDRTSSEPYRGWGLWTTSQLPILPDGESYRHDWIGCNVCVDGIKIGEVVCLQPTPMDYDMVVIRDMRPGHIGHLEVPYIKSWFQIDFIKRSIDISTPPGLLDLDL